MITIELINPPFADETIPSIALTQLGSVVQSRFGDEVKVNIRYFNHDFSALIGQDVYHYISCGGVSNNIGFGEWFFRQAAFPELPDNAPEYFSRYGSLLGPENIAIYEQHLKAVRNNLDVIIESWLLRNNILEVDIVGFTSMFMQNVSSFALARKLKLMKPEIVTIMGGANCETPMGQEIVKNVSEIDYVFSGTALKSFPEFVSGFLENNRTRMESINGVFSKSNIHAIKTKDSFVKVLANGDVETVGPIGDELSINQIVEHDYDGFLSSYNGNFPDSRVKPTLLFETSRGCWWGAKAHCTFCGLNGGGMSYRAMTHENALELLHGLFARYSDRVDYFSSVDNILPKEYIKEVFPQLDVPENVSLFYEVKADLTPDDIRILASANVLRIQPGIESLATSTLKLMKKGTSAFINLRFLMNCSVHSLRPYWNLLIGFPGEQQNVYQKYATDIPLLYHLPPPSGVYPVRFDRYSPYFKEADRYNLKLKPLDYYHLTYPFQKESLENFAYYFADQNYEAKYIQDAILWVDKLAAQVAVWGKKWTGRIEDIPRLYMQKRHDQYEIIDTRYGEQQIHSIDTFDHDLLMVLSSHQSIDSLYSKFPTATKEQIDSKVQRFIGLHLLFEERGSLLSLVFANCPDYRKYIQE